MTTTVRDLESKIRDRINLRRKQHQLLGRSADWNQLCSALNVVGDTELGLDSYLAHEPVSDIGVRYLLVYGALQLLQTQQDAVMSICAALQIRPVASPKVSLVRELRSSSIGHPTRQQENNRSKSNFIVRATLSQSGFTLFTVTASEWSRAEQTVNIPKLIEIQRNALAKTLAEVISTLDATEMKHREQHKGKKLASCFPDTLGYYFSNIFDAIHSPDDYPLGKTHVGYVSECLSCMKSMLQEREEWGINESIEYEHKLLEYPLERLATFFTDRTASGLDSKDAFIYTDFVQHRIERLRQIAGEVDANYEATPDDGTS